MLTSIPLGLRYMAAGAFAFSMMSALAKVAGGTIPIFEIMLARSLVMLAFSGTHLKRRGLPFRGTEEGILVLRGVFGFIALACFYYAVVRLPLADATVLHFTNPVFTAVVAAVVLGEHIGFAEGALVAVSLLGVVIVARPAFLFGDAAALDPVAVVVGVIGAAFAALAYVAVRRLRGEAPMRIVLYFAVVSIVLSLPMVIADPVLPSFPVLLILIALGVATHVGQVFITLGFREERAGRASAVGYLQIVFAAGWSWLLFDVGPGLATWVGAAIIVGSTGFLVRLHPTR